MPSFVTVWLCDNQGEICPFLDVAVPADIIINVRKYALKVHTFYSSWDLDLKHQKME